MCSLLIYVADVNNFIVLHQTLMNAQAHFRNVIRMQTVPILMDLTLAHVVKVTLAKA